MIVKTMKILFLFVIGYVLIRLHLTWLGMGRHGTTGFGFLHLDWIVQPHLSYWGIHVRLLLGLVFGCGLCLWSLFSFLSMLFQLRNGTAELIS